VPAASDSVVVVLALFVRSMRANQIHRARIAALSHGWFMPSWQPAALETIM
jgi:hypothetical protein